MNLEKLTGHAAMFGANSMWGIMSPVSKMVMAGGAVTPMVMTDCRVLGAAVLFWTLSLFLKRDPVSWKDLLLLLLASQFAIVFNQGSFIFGVSLTSPIDASIITTSLPILTLILSAFFLKEPVTGRKITGIVFGATGAILLVFGGQQVSAGNGSNIWGDLLILTAQLSFSIYLVFFRGLIGRYSPITIMKWMFTYAFVCVLPFSFGGVAATDWPALGGGAIGAIAFIVAGGTFLSYMLVVVGQKRLRPTVAGMYNYIQPLVASIVAVCWGMDRFNVVKVLAVVLIFGGVYLVTVSPSRAGLEAAEHGHETGRNGGEGAGCRAEDDGIRLSDKYKRPR